MGMCVNPKVGGIGMERYAAIIGTVFLYVGGSILALLVLTVLAELMAEAWIYASNRWRGILKAEKLIREYREYRDEFKEWLEERNGGE